MAEIRRHCPICGKLSTVKVEDEDYKKWQNGGLVQNCFPYLTSDEREVIVSGICSECWDIMFSKPKK